MYPIYIICGNAGSGKDTVASMLVRDAKLFGQTCVTVAQASPLKDFGKLVLGFSNEQLYGPSEMRNAADPRFVADRTAVIYRNTYNNLEAHGTDFARRFCTGARHLSVTDMQVRLFEWFRNYIAQFAGNVSPRNMLQQLGTEFGRALGPNIWSNIAIETCISHLEGGASAAIITDGRFKNEILNVKKLGGTAIKVNGTTSGVGVEHQSESELLTIPGAWFDIVINNDKSKGLNHLSSVVRDVYLNMKWGGKIFPAEWCAD